MASTASVSTDLERRQEQAAREFIERSGYRNVRDVAFIPGETEPLDARSVHVQMPTLRFTHWAGTDIGRLRGEISAVGLTIPTR